MLRAPVPPILLCTTNQSSSSAILLCVFVPHFTSGPGGRFKSKATYDPSGVFSCSSSPAREKAYRDLLQSIPIDLVLIPFATRPVVTVSDRSFLGRLSFWHLAGYASSAHGTGSIVRHSHTLYIIRSLSPILLPQNSFLISNP